MTWSNAIRLPPAAAIVAAVFLGATCGGATCGGATSHSTPRRPVADSIRNDSTARARQDSINRTMPGYVVDSILPVQEELRRFRAVLGGSAAVRLAGGSASREALARHFVGSLAANDTTGLRAMALSAREFADLYYPESQYAHAPYRQSPALAWELIQNAGDAGFARLVRRLGGRPVTYAGLTCDPKAVREGRNTKHTGCVVHLRDERGAVATRRLFGSIVERDGQFKFMSFTNRF